MSGLNEHDIMAVKHEFFLDYGDGLTEDQINASQAFVDRLLAALLAKNLIDGEGSETPGGLLHLETRSLDDMVKYATEEISGMGISQAYKTKLLGMIMAICQKAESKR